MFARAPLQKLALFLIVLIIFSRFCSRLSRESRTCILTNFYTVCQHRFFCHSLARNPSHIGSCPPLPGDRFRMLPDAKGVCQHRSNLYFLAAMPPASSSGLRCAVQRALKYTIKPACYCQRFLLSVFNKNIWFIFLANQPFRTPTIMIIMPLA